MIHAYHKINLEFEYVINDLIVLNLLKNIS